MVVSLTDHWDKVGLNKLSIWHRTFLWLGVSQPQRLDIWGGWFSVVGGCPVRCWIFRSLPGPAHEMPAASWPRAGMTQNTSILCPVLLGVEEQDQPQLRPTGFNKHLRVNRHNKGKLWMMKNSQPCDSAAWPWAWPSMHGGLACSSENTWKRSPAQLMFPKMLGMSNRIKDG